MRQSEIQIGSVYYTKVGPDWRPVEVVAAVQVTSAGSLGKPRITTKYQVKHVDSHKYLPKLRSAAALRSTP